MGFRLVTGFIDHGLLLPTNNYNTFLVFTVVLQSVISPLLGYSLEVWTFPWPYFTV
jgi:hypothetical protein